jgi:hypothetical protein
MSSVDERIAALETQMAALMAENKSLKTKKTKEVKEVKEAKNSTGPSEWNIFVRATWLEMAASAGVLMGEGANAEKEFKAAAKEAGASYQAAMKEASRRRDGNEKPKAEKPKADKSAKADKPKVEKPKADKPKEEKAIADVFADLGMCIKVIDEKKYLVCDDGEAFNLTEDGNMGERAGRYDADTDTIDETE